MRGGGGRGAGTRERWSREGMEMERGIERLGEGRRDRKGGGEGRSDRRGRDREMRGRGVLGEMEGVTGYGGRDNYGEGGREGVGEG